ncbi:MAG: helix-turn-helix domain-containing protein [Balneolaceae bacterium]
MAKKIGSLTLYTVDDLHELLGISKMTLRAYLRDGRLKGRKLGVQWYVSEEAIRDYFNTDNEKEEGQMPGEKKKKKKIKYIVQGVNDLVSETEECRSVSETLECLHSQAIISLFQVRIVDAENEEVLEVIKAREFIERYSK